MKSFVASAALIGASYATKIDSQADQFNTGSGALASSSLTASASGVRDAGFFYQSEEPFLSNAEFTTGVNLSADVMIAIEALRNGINDVQEKYEALKERHDTVKDNFDILEGDIAET